MSGILSIKKTLGSNVLEPRAGYATLFINENGVPLVKDENGTVSAFSVTSVNGQSGAVVLTATSIGAEQIGAADILIDAHEASANPHAQYALTADLASAISFELAQHTSAADPHDQYFRKAVANNPNQPVLLDDDVKIPAQYLPSLSITDTFVVADESAMINLIAQRGDFAFREDEGSLYVLFGAQANILSDWKKLQQNGVVMQVNGKTGSSITLNTSDIAEGSNLYFTNARASAAAPVQTVNGQSGAVVLSATSVGADAAGTAAAQRTAHEAAADPHPQYTTTAEAAAAAPVQSVNGRTGAVVITHGDVGADQSGTASFLMTQHINQSNPHPQYTTAAQAAAAAPVQSVNGQTGTVNITAATLGIDAAGAAAAAITAHKAEGNPHSQYVTLELFNNVFPTSIVNTVNGQNGDVNITAASIQALDVNDLTAHRFDPEAHPDLPTAAEVAADISAAIAAHAAAADPHPQYTTTAEATAAANTVLSSHTSAGDPHPQYTTTAEATAAANTVLSSHTSAGDPHPQYTTTAEAAAAAPVQSVNGMTGAVVINTGTGGGIANTVINASSSPSFTNTTNANGVDFIAPANTLVANKALELRVMGLLTNTTATSNLLFEILIDGIVRHQHIIPVGTTARTNAVFRIDAVFAIQTGGTSSQTKMISHGTLGLTPYVLHGSATTNLFNINYTEAKTIGMRVRSSAATTTGSVIFSSTRDYV
jgi:hypothetical protein